MKPVLLASALLAGTVTVSSVGFAAYGKTHPRIHEVNTRLRVQDHRIDRRLAAGKISSQSATTLHNEDGAVKTLEQADKSADRGHLTKADKQALNQQLDVISKEIGGRLHPRLHEVNARLVQQASRIDRDEADGKISADQAQAFQAEDVSITNTEQTDKSLDDGHITRIEQRALNQELNGVSRQIGSAVSGTSGAGGGSGSHGSSHGSHK